MVSFKYWHFILLITANTVLANDDSSEEEWDWTYDPLKWVGETFVDGVKSVVNSLVNVHTQYYISSTNCAQKKCKIGSKSTSRSSHYYFNKCCHSLKENSRLTVLIHGYSRDSNEIWINNITEQLTKLPNSNVIAINWQVQFPLGHADNTRLYEVAYNNIEKIVNQSVKFLKKFGVKKLHNIHILGHSMGAHIAGLIGGQLKKNYGIKVKRITGLDPALPLFRTTGEPDLSLRPSHADFVDVIHTNSNHSEDSTFGLYRTLGHVDFYPNNGDKQPGCEKSARNGRSISLNDLEESFWEIASDVAIGEELPKLAENMINKRDYLICNHFYATEYMIASIIKNQRCEYLAVPWEDKEKLKKQSVKDVCKNGKCIEMGINAEEKKNLTGRYYIDMSKLKNGRGDCMPTVPTASHVFRQ